MNLFNKKKGNRGFTLVELLAAIVILGILSTMAIVSVSNLIKKAKSSAEDANAKTIQMAAESYIQANKDTAPKSIGECVTVSASDLKNKKFLTDEITNSNNESCMKNSYVKIFKSSNGKYIYTPYIYCGADKASTDSKDKMVPVGEIKFSKSTDVNKASFTLNLYGDQNKTKGQYTPTTEIDGYSWSLSVMYDGENSYTEVYNTGTLSANKAKFLEISEKLSDYVDISSVTKVKVDYMITNVVCETYTSEMVSDDGASSTTQFEDTVPPICGAVSGDASSEKDWVSNSSSSKTRLVSVACSDGDGSGCKRKSFSRSWPDKSAPYGVEKAYVDIYDNRDKKFDGNSETGNKTKCLVDVNVDLQTPSGSLIAAKTATGKNILSSKKALEIKASTDPIASNVVRVNDYSGTTSNWMNGTDFKDGVYFIVKVKDNLHLDHYTWETNKGDQTSVNESDVSVNYPDGVASTQIPQVAKYGKTALHGSTEYIITVRLNTEGKRYGVLTVYDKAGNAIKYEMYANIDKTAPPVPEISLYKWKTNEEKNKPTNKTSGLDLYTEGSWTDKKIIAIPKSTDDKTSAADIIYKYTTTGKTTNEEDTIGNYRNIEKEGESTIKFKACDKAGNCSKYSDKKTVKLELQKPTLEITNTKATKDTISVTLNASALSGIAKYEYYNYNGKNWEECNDKTCTLKNLTQNTKYKIKVRVTSNAGNTNEGSKDVYTKFYLTTGSVRGGKITLNKTEVSKGDEVSIDTAPEDDFTYKGATIVCKDDTKETLTEIDEDKDKFDVPNCTGKITVYPKWRKNDMYWFRQPKCNKESNDVCVECKDGSCKSYDTFQQDNMKKWELTNSDVNKLELVYEPNYHYVRIYGFNEDFDFSQSTDPGKYDARELYVTKDTYDLTDYINWVTRLECYGFDPKSNKAVKGFKTEQEIIKYKKSVFTLNNERSDWGKKVDTYQLFGYNRLKLDGMSGKYYLRLHLLVNKHNFWCGWTYNYLEGDTYEYGHTSY